MRPALMGAAAFAIILATTAGGALAHDVSDGVDRQDLSDRQDFSDPQETPPNARPGHCYAKFVAPARYETFTEQVIDSPAHTETRIIPAVMGYERQQVLVSDAHVAYETLPAVYRTVTETVVVRPATLHKQTLPAVYGEETERVLVREAHTEWQRGAHTPHDGLVAGSSKLLPTGEVLCLVEVPAEYRTITHQVVRVPERVIDVVEPAQTTTVTRQVVDQPARVIEHQIPAVYRTVDVPRIIQPQATQTVVVPAVLHTAISRRLVSSGRIEWRPIRCAADCRDRAC